MRQVTIDQVLAKIRAHLHLSKETEREMLAEIRPHLEDAMTEAANKGEDEQASLLKAAERFGIDEAGSELQEVHTHWESINATLLSALPVLFTIILRWLAFAPDGSALHWPQLLTRPGFWIVAAVALLIPALRFRRWRFALAGWMFFWLLTCQLFLHLRSRHGFHPQLMADNLLCGKAADPVHSDPPDMCAQSLFLQLTF